MPRHVPPPSLDSREHGSDGCIPGCGVDGTSQRAADHQLPAPPVAGTPTLYVQVTKAVGTEAE